jgi:hypothetical protein
VVVEVGIFVGPLVVSMTICMTLASVEQVSKAGSSCGLVVTASVIVTTSASSIIDAAIRRAET